MWGRRGGKSHPSSLKEENGKQGERKSRLYPAEPRLEEKKKRKEESPEEKGGEAILLSGSRTGGEKGEKEIERGGVPVPPGKKGRQGNWGGGNAAVFTPLSSFTRRDTKEKGEGRAGGEEMIHPSTFFDIPQGR